MFKSSRVLLALAAAATVLSLASPSWAALLLEAKGWQISGGHPRVPIVVVTQLANPDPNVLEIQIEEGIPVQPDSGPPFSWEASWSNTLGFQQIAPDDQTAGRIIISHETIHNGTGQTWQSFSWIIRPTSIVNFNWDLIYPGDPTLGFSTGPFTNHTIWTSEFFPDMLGLRVTGGAVAYREIFTPGITGGLVIDVDKASDGDAAGGLFALQETATIWAPEPGTLAILMLGYLGTLLKRRR